LIHTQGEISFLNFYKYTIKKIAGNIQLKNLINKGNDLFFIS